MATPKPSKLKIQASANGKNNCAIRLLCVRSTLADVTVELQCLEHLWNHENMFKIGVVRANEC